VVDKNNFIYNSENEIAMKKLCAISTVDVTLSSFVVDAMRKLKDEGYDITLISSMSEDFFNKHKNEFHCINLQMSRGTNPIEMLKSIWAFYKIFRCERFDYIQYATPNASLYASVAAFMVGCPIRVYCQWGIRYVGFEGMKRKFFKALEVLTCKLSTHIRPASPKNLLFAVAEGHYPEKKAAIIGAGGTIGVDFKVFDKSKKEAYKAAVIEEYPILKDRFVFGFVGRMDRDKGTNELFTSFLKLYQKYPNIALLFIGPEDKITGIDTILYQAVKDSGAAVFTGFTNEVPKYISAMDVLVHPSYREGFSMVIQQAMAMEIAVVTTRPIGGH
jgi:glycosyltransferase involved in cell wall biosynthesis